MSGPPRAFSVVEPDAQPAAPLAGFSPRSAEDEAHRKSLHDAWSAARAAGEECTVVFDDRRPSSAGKVAATLVAADWVYDDFTLRMLDGAERNTVGSRIALQQELPPPPPSEESEASEEQPEPEPQPSGYDEDRAAVSSMLDSPPQFASNEEAQAWLQGAAALLADVRSRRAGAEEEEWIARAEGLLRSFRTQLLQRRIEEQDAAIAAVRDAGMGAKRPEEGALPFEQLGEMVRQKKAWAAELERLQGRPAPAPVPAAGGGAALSRGSSAALARQSSAKERAHRLTLQSSTARIQAQNAQVEAELAAAKREIEALRSRVQQEGQQPEPAPEEVEDPEELPRTLSEQEKEELLSSLQHVRTPSPLFLWLFGLI